MAPRVNHDPEEAKRRSREYHKQYAQAHKEELQVKRRIAYMSDPEAARAKRRQQYHANINRLVEAGVYTPLRPGRKRLYTQEEAAEVAKRQRHESCYVRRQERLNASRALLTQG